MNSREKGSISFRMKGYIWIFFIVWTCCVAASLAWNIVQQREAILFMSRMKAEHALSMQPLHAIERRIQVQLSLAHGVIWMLGIAGIAFAANRFSAQNEQTKSSEKRAKKERDKAERYLNIAAEIILSLDAHGKITLLNDSGHRLLGYESGALIGKNWFETCLPEKAREEVSGFLEQLKQVEVDVTTCENPVMAKDGTERLILWRYTVLRDDAGGFIETLSSGEDITDRKRAEEIYRVIFNNATDGIVLINLENQKINSANNSMSQMLGYSLEDLKKLSSADIHPKEDLPYVFEQIENQAKDELASAKDLPMKRKDGSVFFANVRGNMIILSGQKYLLGIFRDISERKRAENEQTKMLLWQQGVSHLLQSLLVPAPFEVKLASITDEIVSIFEADFCRIWLTRPGDLCERGCVHAEASEGPHVCRYRDRCLHLLASSGRYTHTDGTIHRRVPFGCYKIGRIASGDEHRFLTNDVQNDPRVHNLDWARELGLVSFAGYQLRAPGGETMGVMALFAKHPILPIEELLLDSISSAVGSIVQQAATEDALRESEERYAMILGAVNDGFWDWDIPSGGALFSPLYYSILGYDDGEFTASYTSWRLLVHPEDIDRVEQDLQQNIKTGKGFNIDLRMKMKSGEWRWVSTRGKTIERDEDEKAIRIVGTLTDISDRKRAEENISMLSSEREILLKEVHHRIKNNMTMIASFLWLQASRLSEPGAVKALHESHNRVMSMAAIYDILFRTTDFRYVSVNEYIGQVVDGITASLPAVAGVKIEKRIDDFVMDSKILFPIGIIINELVTNAYKYAFPENGTGTITVSVSRLPERNRVEMTVSDDGAGIPENVDINAQSGFGMKLVTMLVKQIEGTFECVRGGGTTFRIIFEYIDSPPDPPEGGQRYQLRAVDLSVKKIMERNRP